MKKRLFSIFFCIGGALFAQPAYDLVVYGGTAAGVMTAVSAARQGLKVALLEPGVHVGGMVSGGLSATDVGRREVIGGLALEFYFRAARHYSLNRHHLELAWRPEPKVAEAVFREMIAEARVTLLQRQRLREKNGVVIENGRISEIITEPGWRFRARIFADASYEGDLMTQAKVSYTFGREGVAQYGESLAGVRAVTPSHQFPVNIPARDEQGRLLPEISPEPRGEPGSADKRIQAYNFRIAATNVAANRVPWPKPDNYDPAKYELLLRYIHAMTPYLGRTMEFTDVSSTGLMPNGKADLNNRGGFSTDYIGKNYDYPDGDYATRARIWKDHEDYQKGFYYFLANDPRLPESMRRTAQDWGLSKDEFTDTGHWPHQLYVREARRMLGEYVSIQKDLQTELAKPDAIAMGSYNSDSHNVQRFINAQGFAENEGDVQVGVKPYHIPYRVITPKRAEALNLLVPVCFSASHVAYSSMRMEPQYMMIGHAAGIAAALAIRGNSSVQDIAVPALQQQLKDEGAVFEYGPRPHQAALEIIRRRFAPLPKIMHDAWRLPVHRAPGN
ncbi:MAG: FAD-dependent oxidoreductase [Bryobacteraceae bacterium]|nr:FAD-dependent oxidoreductase [Solibacteraceae bacterium]MCO5353405.1 FAD-dependent oxidoreductase [Bryobacteraceae bacterium]